MGSVVDVAVTELQLPPGALGPDAVSSDVRCFVVPHPDGIVLVDTGLPPSVATIEDALLRLGASWSDVTDVVLTHRHPDHTGSLKAVLALATGATPRAGAEDAAEIGDHSGHVIQPLDDGEQVGALTVVATPGHTPGHISLFHEAASLLLIGDLVGNFGDRLTLGPPQFTADPVRRDASLSRVLDLDADRILFSHGPEIADPNNAIRELVSTDRKPQP